MISINPITVDIEGGVMLQPISGTNDRPGTRRVSKRKLLDGTVSIYDGGYCDGDNDLTIQARVTKAEHERFETIAQTYNEVTVATTGGCYIGVISTWSYRQARLFCTIMLKQRISE